MSESAVIDVRATYSGTPTQWEYWSLLAALGLGALYLLFLPVLVA